MRRSPSRPEAPAKAGGIHIAMNAAGILHVQGIPSAELSFQGYAHPITAYTRTHFLTAKAVARHMMGKGAGVILLLSTPASRAPVPGVIIAYRLIHGRISRARRQDRRKEITAL
jgi:3-oxoacyl-[acyl-carrier protein] reductase